MTFLKLTLPPSHPITCLIYQAGASAVKPGPLISATGLLRSMKEAKQRTGPGHSSICGLRFTQPGPKWQDLTAATFYTGVWVPTYDTVARRSRNREIRHPHSIRTYSLSAVSTLSILSRESGCMKDPSDERGTAPITPRCGRRRHLTYEQRCKRRCGGGGGRRLAAPTNHFTILR